MVHTAIHCRLRASNMRIIATSFASIVPRSSAFSSSSSRTRAASAVASSLFLSLSLSVDIDVLLDWPEPPEPEPETEPQMEVGPLIAAATTTGAAVLVEARG